MMKRTLRDFASKADHKTRAIDPKGLTTVRGGLRISVQLALLSMPDIPLQHNETLVRIEARGVQRRRP